MSDPILALGWTLVLGCGLGAITLLHRAGLPGTYARDLLHVGAGTWVLGWPFWDAPVWPLALVGAAAAGIFAAPLLARHLPPLSAFVRAVSSGDERWSGIALYTVAFLAATAAGLMHAPLPATAALWALCLGDGIGGLVGRRFGRHTFGLPWGKRKSWEGTAAVASFAAVGILAAGAWLGTPVPAAAVLAGGVLGAAAEAVAPRSGDNLLVPATVWGLLVLWP